MQDSNDAAALWIQRYLDFLLIEKGLSVHTLAAYRADLRRYERFLHSWHKAGNVADITPSDIENFLSTLHQREGKPLAPTSQNRLLATVRGWHRFLVNEGICSQNPALQAQGPQLGKRLPKALTLSEVTALIEAAPLDGSVLDLRDRAMLEVLFGTGARISEAVALSREDFDFRSTAPTVRLFGKGRKERYVPIGKPALTAVENYLVRARPELASRGQGVSATFLNQRGAPLSRQSAWGLIRSRATQAGLHIEISPHTLRHTYATLLLEGGADVRVVQELLGHASVTTTQIYTKVSAQLLRETLASAHPRYLPR